MNMENLKTIAQCLTADITKDRVALHETGHVIAMYAVGLIDHIAFVTKTPGDGTRGLTEVTEEYKTRMNNLGDEIIQAAGKIIQAAGKKHYGKDYTRIIQLSRLDASQLYFPNICKLFGGGAICRFYDLPDEDMCSIDYTLIDAILNQFNWLGKREVIMPLVDQYLRSAFESFGPLIKAFYVNLVEQETLTREQVLQIIKDWEEYQLS